jgi:hypothetical protein
MQEHINKVLTHIEAREEPGSKFKHIHPLVPQQGYYPLAQIGNQTNVLPSWN